MKVYSVAWYEKLRKLDYIIFFCVVSISTISVLTLAGAADNFGAQKLYIQLCAVVLGIVLMSAISTIDYQELIEKLTIPIYAASILLLIVTLIIGTGDGNKSWIRFDFMPIGIQPSEFIKICFIMTFSKHLSLVGDEINKIKNVIALCIHAGILIGLILLQGDLGTALVYMAVMAVMLFAAGLNIWYFVAAAGLIVIASPFVWQKLGIYQQERIIAGFMPETDPLGYGYQALMSRNAIAAGGFWGSGFSGGTEYQNIPFAHTDFIFAVTSEKFGFFGVLIYFLLMITLIVRIFSWARRARKDYAAYICVGVATVLIVQMCENVGMCLAALPVVGITLPFMSYGGSSVVSLYCMMGLVQSVCAHQDKYFFEREMR